MAYSFALESVLKHRQRLEDVAQRELIEAQAALNAALNEIEAMYQRADEVREEISAAERQGSANHIAQVVESETFLIGFAKQIEMKRHAARELMTNLEIKQEALTIAAREKKVLASLKDKRKAEHKAWVARIETKEMDDLTTMRRGRK